MLQIQNIEIGWVHNSAENLCFDFMVETMKDIHLMQEIIRNYITSYFCIKSNFGSRVQICLRKADKGDC